MVLVSLVQPASVTTNGMKQQLFKRQTQKLTCCMPYVKDTCSKIYARRQHKKDMSCVDKKHNRSTEKTNLPITYFNLAKC